MGRRHKSNALNAEAQALLVAIDDRDGMIVEASAVRTKLRRLGLIKCRRARAGNKFLWATTDRGRMRAQTYRKWGDHA
jgi:hypothetical protein